MENVSPASADQNRAPGAPEGLDAAIGRYLDQLSSGQEVDPLRVLAENPDDGTEILRGLQDFVDLESAVEHPGKDADQRPLGDLGDYELRRKVGSGGMGVVYEAWQKSVGRRVALKALPAGLAADLNAWPRFLREAQAAGKLSHPNVVGVHATGVERDTPYYAMEFIDGETLSDILKRVSSKDGDPSESEDGTALFSAGPGGFFGQRVDLQYCLNAARAFAGVADGLEHAHQRGVIHRDIKPSNLILDAAGRIRILDFGLARLEGQEQLTLSGDLVGTLAYMSPEQAQGRIARSVDHRTDVYSLGATLYEVLAWTPPFKGRTPEQTLSHVIHDEAQPLSQRNRLVPRDLETIVSKCLMKNPDERYRTAEAVAQDLRRFSRGDPVEARPQAGLQRLARRMWRHRVKLAVALVVLTLFTALGIVASWSERQERLLRESRYRPLVLSAIFKLQSANLGGRHLESEVTKARGFVDQAEMEAFATPGVSRLEEAVLELEAAAAIFPDRADAYYQLALARHFQGQDQRALRELERAVECAQGFVPALVLRTRVLAVLGELTEARRLRSKILGSRQAGWAVHSLAAFQATEEFRWQDAADAYGRLLTVDESGAEPYLGAGVEARLGRGLARLRAGDHDGAVEDFSGLRSLYSQAIEPALLLGRAYVLMGKHERAERTFREIFSRADAPDPIALAVAAHYRDLRHDAHGLAWIERIEEPALRERNRILFLATLDRPTEAIDAGERALGLDPSDAVAMRHLAWVYERVGRSQDALRMAAQAVAQAPESAAAYQVLAVLRSRAGDHEQAEALFREAIRRDPLNPISYNLLGNLHRRRRQLDAAAEQYHKAAELSPRYGNTLANLYGILQRQGLLEETIARLREGLRSSPHDRVSLFRLAIALKSQWRLPEAIEVLRSLTECSPGDAQAYWYLLSCLTSQKEFDLARETAERLIAIDPYNPSAHGVLGELHLRQGELKKAEASCRRALALRPSLLEVHPRLGVVLREQGRTAEAVEEFCYTIAAAPTKSESTPVAYRHLGDILRSPDRPANLAAQLDLMIASLERTPAAQKRRFRNKRFLQASTMLALSWAYHPERSDPEKALHYARLAVEKYDRDLWPRLVLAEVLGMRGRLRESVRALEAFAGQSRGPSAGRRSSSALSRGLTLYRGALFPELASYSHVDALLEMSDSELELGIPPGRTRDEEILRQVKEASVDDEASRAWLAYLRGRVLQRRGDFEGASEKFRELPGGPGSAPTGDPEPKLRLAECLRSQGDPTAAAAVLQEAIGSDGALDDSRLWSLWQRVLLTDLERPLAEVFAQAPDVPGSRNAAAFRWLLGELAAGRSIRIDCGGTCDRSTGKPWAGDRFFSGGKSWRSDRKVGVRGALDEGIYLTQRRFRRMATAPGYSIPLPDGEYRVTLHFVELWDTRRRFDCRIEGQVWLSDYCPGDRGLGVAEARTTTVSVVDGALDLEFPVRVGWAAVAAIEIRPEPSARPERGIDQE